MWSEINSRVNYPVKSVLVEMIEKGQLNIEDPLQLFCMSWLSIRVCFAGIELFVKSWNFHTMYYYVVMVTTGYCNNQPSCMKTYEPWVVVDGRGLLSACLQ